ncbi:CheR family methyltransferase [Sphingomonas morindae]|uniref:Protein-glutamate O-methyltransferase CheR n=1 Tax=Sphingomonas morindae TaxID=1541170 RepID=A0ABY4X8A1_9SPHN|nr:protein-glutamate O-methyltransferase CheR [Sphingomonas morindae]USI73099.1 protein-glutamate O-methyltransferase CheR [Sphingomonas morindae]
MSAGCEEVGEGALRILAGLVEARTGQQFAADRRWRLDSALRPLLARFDAPTLDSLIGRVISGREAALADAVVEALLNHETFFYRDMASFKQLEEQGLARLREARAERRTLRIWSAGCSTGQEPYSLAMMFADRAAHWAGWQIEILATDLSPEVIVRARAGLYSQMEVQRGLPIRQMMRRFDARPGDSWQANEALRRAVTFRVHNVLEPPPAGPFDIILCRNVLLYFSADVRRLVFDRLASAIAPDGVLMLGAGETTLGQTARFVSDEGCRGLFRPGCAEPDSHDPPTLWMSRA